MNAADLFSPLERVVAKYRRDVHELSTEAQHEALTALEGHLGRALPADLRAFLARHNGAHLFRGALRIRSTAEMSLASEQASQVVLFADQHDGTRWAWTSDSQGEPVFGVWDGSRLDARHTRFAGWLRGTLSVLDARVAQRHDQDSLRFEADPTDPAQLIQAGDRAMHAGLPHEAEALYRRATATAPENVLAWQRFGEALTAHDRTAARRAWLEAFRRVRLPLAYPGAPCFDPELLRSLRPAFADDDAWERELERFLQEQVQDVTDAEGAALVVAVGMQLARSRVRRGRRRQAREALSQLHAACRTYAWRAQPWEAILALAGLEIDLGNHDEAEALLRRVRRDAPPAAHGRAWIQLAQLAVARQEPWAEDILTDALAAATASKDEAEEAEAAMLGVERALRQDRLDEAMRWLEAARAGVNRVSLRPLQAHLALLEGEVERQREQPERAARWYRHALELASLPDHAELHWRVHLRLGDLALDQGRPQEAEPMYVAACRGFAEAELPVREAWALLRLARVARDPARLAAAARDRFKEHDIAAGVAATDGLLGDPGLSLGWHLERATAHARARFEAQRCRHGLERADAERPERRLGAHRLAIAACSNRVVTALVKEMDTCARAQSGGRNRVNDPPVLRYIAAVDLLAGHPSFEAAVALLEHLLGRAVEGASRRALQGAIARSPNASLVDGLLTCIERPSEYPGPSVAEAAELLGLRREGVALPALANLAAPGGNPVARRAAVIALGRVGDRKLADHIAPALQDPALAEHAALSLLMLGDRRGLDFHGRALDKGRTDLSGSPGEIVGRFGGPSWLLLLRSAAEGDDDRAIGAIQGLGLLGDPRGLPTLLKKLESRNRQVVDAAAAALHLMSGHAEDMDDPGSRTRYNLWFEKHEGSFRSSLRYRHGQVFEVGHLIDRLGDPDPWVRRTAYDELVITTGQNLPFDAEGPWRVQCAHLAAWRKWWSANRARFPAGGWFLDGEKIG